MNDPSGFTLNNRWIMDNRGAKQAVDPRRPYAWLVEKERAASGKIADTAIIFLTNRECPYHCLMCDLWKNTTDASVPAGAIPEQIAWALERMPPARHLKLYNSGSFFDNRAIPETDYRDIASLVSRFETVIVECHPQLVNERCLQFRDMLQPQLQIALGLETVHPQVLRKLNKRMTLEDFANAVKFLSAHNISTRAFILLRPPFMTEDEGITWAERSLDYAFGLGVECCIVIPVRAGNGAMDLLQRQGYFTPPDIRSLEAVLEYGIGLGTGRVFADVWDISLFSKCPRCTDARKERLISMNLNQQIGKRVQCECDIPRSA